MYERAEGLNPDPEVVSYLVPLLAPAAAPDKPRRWFGCPSFGRKCSHLYLKAPRSLLACRRCLGLKYATQYASRSAREFARRLRHASRIPPRPVGIWQPLTDWPSVRRHLDP